MDRGGDKTGQPQYPPAAAAQVQPGMQGGGKPRIPRHHQAEPPLPAKSGDAAAERQPAGRGIMAEHHAAQAARQTPDNRQRIGQPRRIGEVPQWRYFAPPALYRAAPGQ